MTEGGKWHNKERKRETSYFCAAQQNRKEQEQQEEEEAELEEASGACSGAFASVRQNDEGIVAFVLHS